MRELEALRNRGFTFLPLLDENGDIDLLVGLLGHHGVFDRIVIHSETDAVAEREAGRRVVWSYYGTTAATALALLELDRRHA